MLSRANEMLGYGIQATDGEIGEVMDLYFDCHTGVIRYFVVDTGSWLAGRQVLISTASAQTPEEDAFEQGAGWDWSTESIPVALTREQVQNSPEVDLTIPVSPRHEAELADYYELPTPQEVGRRTEPAPDGGPAPSAEGEADPHLQSVRELLHYEAKAGDETVGPITNCIVEHGLWVIRYIVVDATEAEPGRMLLLAADWIERIQPEFDLVILDLDPDRMVDSPEYNPTEVIDRDFEDRLFAHYGRAPYWSEGAQFSYER